MEEILAVLGKVATCGNAEQNKRLQKSLGFSFETGLTFAANKEEDESIILVNYRERFVAPKDGERARVVEEDKVVVAISENEGVVTFGVAEEEEKAFGEMLCMNQDVAAESGAVDVKKENDVQVDVAKDEEKVVEIIDNSAREYDTKYTVLANEAFPNASHSVSCEKGEFFCMLYNGGLHVSSGKASSKKYALSGASYGLLKKKGLLKRTEGARGMCDMCGYEVLLLGHASRCRLPDAVAIDPTEKYVGDAVYKLMVAAIYKNCYKGTLGPTEFSAEYLTAKTQAGMYRALRKRTSVTDDVAGRSDHTLADRLEAYIVRDKDYFRFVAAMMLVRFIHKYVPLAEKYYVAKGREKARDAQSSAECVRLNDGKYPNYGTFGNRVSDSAIANKSYSMFGNLLNTLSVV